MTPLGIVVVVVGFVALMALARWLGLLDDR